MSEAASVDWMSEAAIVEVEAATAVEGTKTVIDVAV